MLPHQSATTNSQYSEATDKQSCRPSIDKSENIIDEAAPEPSVELRQKLMSADEVYLYKIPPLQTSGGHRYVDLL